MASTSAVSMAMPITNAAPKRARGGVAEAFAKPLLPLRPSTNNYKPVGASKSSTTKFQVRASLKEKAIAGLAATALTASMVLPEVAQAADGVTPSLKNFLLSIASGGLVVTAILGAIIGVSNFDPVKRT